MKLLDVVKVKSVDGLRLLLEFENGDLRRFDMTPFVVRGGVFKELSDQRYFNRVFIENGTVCWPNGQDVCPETLHEDGEPIPSRHRKAASFRGVTELRHPRKPRPGGKMIHA